MRVWLPKQWRHWCKKAGLRPHSRSRKRHAWLYLKGHGRVWRINCFAEFQCGDAYVEFDRWALCHIESAQLPNSEAAFVDTVRELLSKKGNQ